MHITNDAEKCSITLSKCTSVSQRAILAYDTGSKKSYTTLKKTLSHIYKEREKSQQEYYSDFMNITETKSGNIKCLALPIFLGCVLLAKENDFSSEDNKEKITRNENAINQRLNFNFIADVRRYIYIYIF